MSLRAKHSVVSRGKAPGQGVSRGRSPPEADHADDILQFNAQILSSKCNITVLCFWQFCRSLSWHLFIAQSNNLEACSMLNSYFVRLIDNCK